MEKTDKKGQDSTTGTTADSAATQTDSTGTTDQVQLNQEAQKALEKFQAALGVKHTPNGYAYGYYKNKKTQAGATDGEDQDEQAANTNTDTDQAVQQTRTQQQAPAQVQKEVPTQSQPQATQHGNSAEAKNTTTGNKMTIAITTIIAIRKKDIGNSLNSLVVL